MVMFVCWGGAVAQTRSRPDHSSVTKGINKKHTQLDIQCRSTAVRHLARMLHKMLHAVINEVFLKGHYTQILQKKNIRSFPCCVYQVSCTKSLYEKPRRSKRLDYPEEQGHCGKCAENHRWRQFPAIYGSRIIQLKSRSTC